MKNYKILFADLDGTLIKTKSGETFPKGIWDMELRFAVLDAIKKLNPKYILIVSNQDNMKKDFVRTYSFCAKTGYIAAAISEYCDCECYGMYCGNTNYFAPYRKPNTWMLEKLLERHVKDNIGDIKQKSLMIGDASGKEGQFSDSDKRTAENFGIDYMDVNDFINDLL